MRGDKEYEYKHNKGRAEINKTAYNEENLLNLDAGKQFQSKQANSVGTIKAGAGKVPIEFMREEHIYVKTFPRYHPNGMFGLHYEKELKISLSKYFKQRLLMIRK